MPHIQIAVHTLFFQAKTLDGWMDRSMDGGMDVCMKKFPDDNEQEIFSIFFVSAPLNKLFLL